MYLCRMTSIIILVLLHLSFLSIIKTEIIPLCETLKDIQGDEDDSSVKLRRASALCDDLEASRGIADQEDSELIPDFDLNQIDSENDVNQILKRFRRGRSSSSGGGRSSSSSSRSSSSGGSRFFGGSRSSSSSSGGSSRIFSRGSSSSSSSGSRGGIFSRSGTGTASSNHRVRETIRSVIRKPTSSGSGSSGLSGTGGSKPSLSDKIRKITHGSGGSRFGTGGLSGSGGGFGTGSSSSSGGNVWVRAGKTFLPHAVRFGKRYYQRRKYNKGMYAGAGYYAGSGMNNHHGHYYPHNNYGYPPDADQPPAQIDGHTPTVFYCLQQDLNATLVNKTLDDEGFGVCNVSGKLLTCPIEIECKTSEADNCCEDEQGTPYCCGGPIPVEYMSQNGGYGDDWDDATDSLNKLLNIITAICLMMATICFTVWQQQENNNFPLPI